MSVHILVSLEWLHTGYPSHSVFVFGPDGRIRIAIFNAPGWWHDTSTIADYGIYQKLEDLYWQFGVKIVIDSAFNLANKDYLINSGQLDPIGDPYKLQLNQQATSLRQLSEHGMRMIQAQFPRLNDRMLLEDKGERKVIMQLMVYLHNFQASRVGINEILNSFMGQSNGFYNGYLITTDANSVFN